MHLRKRLSTAAAIILIIAAALLLTARAGFYLTLRNKDTGKLYAEECKYYAYGAGVQVELNPGEELSYTEDGALLITGIHQDRTGVCYAVATVYDFFLSVNGGDDISLRDLCGRNALVRLDYEFFAF